MFDINPITPSQDTLTVWKNLTGSNHHKQARNAIGKWAIRHCRDKRMAALMRACLRNIVSIYEIGEKNGTADNDEFEFMCRMTHLLMDMIKNEYGLSTANLIGGTL